MRMMKFEQDITLLGYELDAILALLDATQDKDKINPKINPR